MNYIFTIALFITVITPAFITLYIPKPAPLKSDHRQESEIADRPVNTGGGFHIGEHCGDYKGVTIDCLPRSHEFMDKKYFMTREVIFKECKSKIDKDNVNLTTHGCYCGQSSGGPLTTNCLVIEK